MPTSKKVAKRASEILRSKKSSKSEKSVAASDLAQAKSKISKRGKPAAKAATTRNPGTRAKNGNNR